MAVYDPESETENDLTPAENEPEKKSLTPEEIADKEAEVGDRYNSTGGEFKRRFDQGLGRHKDVRDANLAADDKERADLYNKLGDTAAGFRDADQEAGFFKKEEKKGVRGRFKAFGNRRKVILGGSLVGILIAGGFGLFSFLNTFRLDQIMGMLDQQTFARFNASFEDRSDKWFSAYLRMRLAEVDGDINTENPVFRARRVDTNNPVRDWYRTMRTSSFEADLAKEGIIFESRFIDGQNRLTVLKLNGETVLQPFSEADIKSGGYEDLINSGEYDNRISQLFEGPAESNRVARRQIKNVVNDRTKSYQVFRRRHLRKDIANMTGIREWRMFERSRDKIENARFGIQRKIMNKVFSGDSSSMRFINCLLGGDGCPTTSDPADPDNKVTSTPTGDLGDGDDELGSQLKEDGTPVLDDQGNPLSGSSDDLARDASTAVGEALEEGAEEIIEGGTITDRVLRSVVDMVAKLSGPTAVWDWAQRLATIDGLFAGGKNSPIVILIKKC